MKRIADFLTFALRDNCCFYLLDAGWVEVEAYGIVAIVSSHELVEGTKGTLLGSFDLDGEDFRAPGNDEVYLCIDFIKLKPLGACAIGDECGLPHLSGASNYQGFSPRSCVPSVS